MAPRKRTTETDGLIDETMAEASESQPESVCTGEATATPEIGVYSRTGVLPAFGTQLAAAADIRADLGAVTHVRSFDGSNREQPLRVAVKTGNPTIVIQPSHRALIPTGLYLDIPEEFEVHVMSRSGVPLKTGLVIGNGVGLIDPDYTNEVFVVAINTSSTPVTVTDAERIAQIKLVPRIRFTMKQLSRGPRPKGDRVGGIGSTGVK